jgi:hypothetical protein
MALIACASFVFLHVLDRVLIRLFSHETSRSTTLSQNSQWGSMQAAVLSHLLPAIWGGRDMGWKPTRERQFCLGTQSWALAGSRQFQCPVIPDAHQKARSTQTKTRDKTGTNSSRASRAWRAVYQRSWYHPGPRSPQGRRKELAAHPVHFVSLTAAS